MIPIPNAQRSLLEQDSGNAALYFARMTPYEGPGGKPQKDAIATLGKNINRRLNQDILTAIHAHQTDILKTAARDGTVWELTATLRSPFVSGLGSGHPTETGFTLDRNSGLPFIPASSIKGVLRLACALHLADKEPGSVQKQLDKQGQWTGQWEIPDRHPLFRRYFGDTDSSKKDSVRGQLCFLDAFPTNCGDILKIDIINPHFREYYGGSDEGPVETEKPNPKKFLAVKEGTAFVFRVFALPLPERAADSPDATVFRPFDSKDEQTLQALFEMVFAKLGFGGKTSVGYGRFEMLAVKHSPDFIPPPPWQGWLRELGKVEDWGRLCDLVFHKEEAVQWRDEAGVAQAVKEAAIRVKKKYPKKWTPERDARIAEWLEAVGIPWPELSAPGQGKPEPEASQSELEKSIRAFNDYGVYINAKLDIATLALEEAQALQEQLKKWGCHEKKAKGDKPRHWQALQTRLRELRSQGA